MTGMLFGILLFCLIFSIPIAAALLIAVFSCILQGGGILLIFR